MKMSLQVKCGEAVTYIRIKCFHLDFCCYVDSNGSLYGMKKVMGCLRNGCWISQAFQQCVITVFHIAVIIIF